MQPGKEDWGPEGHHAWLGVLIGMCEGIIPLLESTSVLSMLMISQGFGEWTNVIGAVGGLATGYGSLNADGS